MTYAVKRTIVWLDEQRTRAKVTESARWAWRVTFEVRRVSAPRQSFTPLFTSSELIIRTAWKFVTADLACPAPLCLALEEARRIVTPPQLPAMRVVKDGSH